MVNRLNKSHLQDYITASSRMSAPEVAIGRLIQDELKRQERTVTWLSRKIHCDRRNIYNIFNRNNIDSDLLMRISIAMDVDFFEVFSKCLQIAIHQEITPPANRQRQRKAIIIPYCAKNIFTHQRKYLSPA